jgi:hypothetical protein
MVPRSLPRLRIAVACNVDWNTMVGGDRARFCGQCCQTVYNVERLRPREVADLLERHGERMPCLRLFTRPDGTVVTRSCLHWVTAGIRQVRMGFVSVAALAVGFWSNVFLLRSWLHPEPAALVPVATTLGRPQFTPPPPPPVPGRRVYRLEGTMGDPGPLPDRERIRLRELRREGPAVSEAQMAQAIRPLIAHPKAHTTDLGLSGRVDVLVDVKASGRVRRVDLEMSYDLPAHLRPMITHATKRLRFPPNTVDYQTSFPVLFQTAE